MADAQQERAMARWRLVLGRFADEGLGGSLAADAGYARLDRVLDYLYGREYASRGVRPDGERGGGGGASQLTLPDWVREVRDLFPRDTVEVLQRHALERYEMTGLVTDAEVLRGMEPSYDLLKAVLTFRGLMEGEVLDVARDVIRRTVEELRRKLSSEVRQVLWGRLNRQRHTRLKTAANLDWPRTIRSNLKHYDRNRKVLLLENLHFFARTRTHMPWHIIMAVDCSGSMMDSVIHSAVMAGIFSGLPATRVSVVAFDTSIVDLSGHADDPVEILLSVQLGGGTNIAGALRYCEGLVGDARRTILVFVTDFFEGGPPEPLVAAVRRMREAGVRVLGLAALDAEAAPVYDRQMAQRCADAGAEVAALTPRRLAEWVEKAIS